MTAKDLVTEVWNKFSVEEDGQNKIDSIKYEFESQTGLDTPQMRVGFGSV